VSAPTVKTSPTVHARPVPRADPRQLNQLPIPRSAFFFHPTLSPPNGVLTPNLGKSSYFFFQEALNPPNGDESPKPGKSSYLFFQEALSPPHGDETPKAGKS